MARKPVSNGDEKAKDTRFQPGQIANPAGRPKGSRNRLGEDFVKALADDFEKHGPQAITKVRADRPQDYLKVIASLLPKQAEITVNEYEQLNDAQLRNALSAAIRDLAAFGVDIGVAGSPSGVGSNSQQPTKPISPLH